MKNKTSEVHTSAQRSADVHFGTKDVISSQEHFFEKGYNHRSKERKDHFETSSGDIVDVRYFKRKPTPEHPRDFLL